MTANAPQYTPLRLPDSMQRGDVGPYMRGLREHYGLSQQDVAERLHLRLRFVVAMEQSQFDAIPGKVYAKGYVNTYAEFLGLDAEQVVERCFGAEPSREQQAHFIPAPARKAARRRQVPWFWLGGAAVLAVALYFLTSGSSPQEGAAPEASGQTEDVPESLVDSLRTSPMVTPQNIDCLWGDGALNCFYDQRATTRWVMQPVAPDTATLKAVAVPGPKPEPESEPDEE